MILNARRSLSVLSLVAAASSSLATLQASQSGQPGSSNPTQPDRQSGQPGSTTPADRSRPTDSERDRPSGQAPVSPEAIEKMMAKEQPGEMQTWLKKYEGTWRVEVTDALSGGEPRPAAPATKDDAAKTNQGMVNNRGDAAGGWSMSGTGTAVTEMKHGRHACTKMTGTMGGKAFEGMGALGYNNLANRFECTWQDNMHTGIGYSTGQMDTARKELTLTGECTDPMTGRPAASKSVTRWENDNRYIMEFFFTGADGGAEKRMVVMTFTREGAGQGMTNAPTDSDRQETPSRDQPTRPNR